MQLMIYKIVFGGNNMNFSIKLTLLRVILMPLFMILFMSCGTVGFILHCLLSDFILAAVTDFRWSIARRTNSDSNILENLWIQWRIAFDDTGATSLFLAADVPYINAWV